jgi:hypothetical protein
LDSLDTAQAVRGLKLDKRRKGGGRVAEQAFGDRGGSSGAGPET